MPIMNPNYGVYPRISVYKKELNRICFHKKESNIIQVSIAQSSVVEYKYKAKDLIVEYNSENKTRSFLPYLYYDLNKIIDKLESDLNFFIKIPKKLLEYADDLKYEMRI